MKIRFVFVCWLVLLFRSAPAEIRNGYSQDKKGAQESLKSLREILSNDGRLTLLQKTDIKNKIERLTQFLVYAEMTDQMLHLLQEVSPTLYGSVDTLKDKNGRFVHVYVKIMPEESMQGGVSGTTSLGQLNDDVHAYQSEYGTHTVAIRISAVNKSLSLLAHEFGHAIYQVPNLASYMVFYSSRYMNYPPTSAERGHHSDDPSGSSAHYYENIFSEDFANHEKGEKKIISPVARLVKIRKLIVASN